MSAVEEYRNARNSKRWKPYWLTRADAAIADLEMQLTYSQGVMDGQATRIAELERTVDKYDGMLRLAWYDIDDDFPDEVSEGDFEGYVADLELRWEERGVPELPYVWTHDDLPQGSGCTCERCSAATAAERDLAEGEGFVADVRLWGRPSGLRVSPEPSQQEDSDPKPRLGEG